MTSTQYRAWLAAHSMGHEQAGHLFAVTGRASRRWAAGARPVPPLIATLMRMIDDHPPLLKWLEKAAAMPAVSETMQ